MYFLSPFFEVPWAMETRLRCGAGFKQCLEEYDPDLVVSLHPLCQHLPLTVMRNLGWRRKTGEESRVPFATVVTDLGSAHGSWFVKDADACFVPSDAVRKVAKRRGIASGAVEQLVLPRGRNLTSYTWL